LENIKYNPVRSDGNQKDEKPSLKIRFCYVVISHNVNKNSSSYKAQCKEIHHIRNPLLFLEICLRPNNKYIEEIAYYSVEDHNTS